jgi:uncharacterized repeat protein (TIGR01451 family)
MKIRPFFRSMAMSQLTRWLQCTAVSLPLSLAGCSAGSNPPAPPAADLSISAVDSLDPLVAGNQLIYTFTVANAGPDNATSVVVTGTLPAGVTPVSTSGCTESPVVAATCSLGDIAAAGSANFAITVSVNAGTLPGNLTSTASLASATADPQSANNMSATTTSVLFTGAVIGTQQIDIRRAPTRLFESAMGNLVADAMRWKYPGAEAAFTNSGGLRADILCMPPSAGEAACEMTWGEMFAVLPFGNRLVVETLTGAQLEAAFLNGFLPKCDNMITTGRFPQVSGLAVMYHCNGTTPVVDGMWKAPAGTGGALTTIGATDLVRLVTNDFLYGGGDGYSVFAQGTNVQQPGEDILKAVFEYLAANSPVAPVVDGRILATAP